MRKSRYTEQQLAAGREARGEGLSHAQVAAAAGVKSKGHFSRVLREVRARFAAASEEERADVAHLLTGYNALAKS